MVAQEPLFLLPKGLIGEQEKGLQQATREVDPDTPILGLHAFKTRLRISRAHPHL